MWNNSISGPHPEGIPCDIVVCVLSISIGSIIGIVLAAVVLVLLLLMLVCCCCPCCMLHKNKKETGRYWGGPKRSPTPAAMANGQSLMENYLLQQQHQHQVQQQFPMQQVMHANQQGMAMGIMEQPQNDPQQPQQAMFFQDQNGYIQQVSVPFAGQPSGANFYPAQQHVGQIPVPMPQQMFVPQQQVQQPLLGQAGNFQGLQQEQHQHNLASQQHNVFQR